MHEGAFLSSMFLSGIFFYTCWEKRKWEKTLGSWSFGDQRGYDTCLCLQFCRKKRILHLKQKNGFERPMSETPCSSTMACSKKPPPKTSHSYRWDVFIEKVISKRWNSSQCWGIRKFERHKNNKTHTPNVLFPPKEEEPESSSVFTHSKFYV